MSDNRPERKPGSLGRRMFVTILLFSLALIAAGSAFGVFLFRKSTEEAYAKVAMYVGESNAEIYRDAEFNGHLVTELINIYESLPSDVAADPKSDEYHEYFRALESDARYEKMLSIIRDITEYQDVSAMSLNVFDEDASRLLYVLDTREDSRHRFPGSYRTLKGEVLWNSLANGKSENTQYIVLESESTGTRNLISWSYTAVYTSESGEDYDVLIMTEVDMAAVARREHVFLLQYLIMILALTVVLDFIIVMRMRRNVVEPLNTMAKAAKTFADNADDPDDESQAFGSINVHTGDEIEKLADSLKAMEADRTRKTRDLIALNTEKERLNAELSVAAQIQNDALPSVFPPFPGRNEFEIYAMMEPAKEVGGDFYDFILLDDDHLMITIDDVSGKGIPGALFMMTSKSLIANLVRLYPDDPALVLKKLNEQICENNKASMFVTVWLAVLEISSGRMICTNAGHEYPAIYQNGEFTLLKDRHGLAAGCFETAKFTNYEIQLTPGDAVFVYTDGVPESNNTDAEMYGTDRMLRALNYNRDSDMKKLLLSVMTSIREFSSGAEQFDDITMVGLRWYGPEYGDNGEQ